MNKKTRAAARIFFALRPLQAGRRCAVKRFAPQILEPDGLCLAGWLLWGPAKSRFCGMGKKKMRSLGTVQIPTEAFLAVLKLDE